jgi:mannosyltransferase OCH1-like enzyme
LRENFNSDVLWAFDIIKPGAFKADLFRYAYLYIKGGVYVDLDCVPLVPLLDFIDKDASFISVSERRGIPGVYQAFMACVPSCSFLIDAVNLIVDNCKQRFVPRKQDWEGILSITGPVLLAKAMQNKYQSGWHQLDGMDILLYRLVGDYILDDNDRKLIYTKFDDFSGENYERLVKQNRIYMDSRRNYTFELLVSILLLAIFMLIKKVL